MKKIYYAKWYNGTSALANVSFEARSDYEAKVRAAKVKRDLGLQREPEITHQGRLIK